MTKNIENYERFISPTYCSICGLDTSIDKCDCIDDLSDIVEDDYGDDRECF